MIKTALTSAATKRWTTPVSSVKFSLEVSYLKSLETCAYIKLALTHRHKDPYETLQNREIWDASFCSANHDNTFTGVLCNISLQSAYIIWFTGYYWCGLIGFLFAEMICSSTTSARLDLMPACSSSVFVCVTQLKWEVFITFCGQKVFVNIHTLVICASSVLPPHCVTRKSSSARTRGDTFNASTLSCCVHVNS